MLISILIGLGTIIAAGIAVFVLSYVAYHTYHEGVPGVIISGGAIILAIFIAGFVLNYFFGG